MPGPTSNLSKINVFTPPSPPNGRSVGSIFWGEISPCEHAVQIYEDDSVFLGALESFIVQGLEAGEGVVLIATPAHREAVAKRVEAAGHGLAAAAAADQYIALDAHETLARFMVPLGANRWPDDARFRAVVGELLRRAGRTADGQPRRVRVFGEMVAILWKEGDTGATLRLEGLWHGMCQESAFCLFCAYPRAYFTQSAEESIAQICKTHSMVVPGRTADLAG